MKKIIWLTLLLGFSAYGSSTGGVFIGSVLFPGTATCIWARTSFQSYASFSAVAACTLPSGGGIVGSHVAAPGTKIPAIVIDAGGINTTDVYEFVATGSFFSNTVDNGCTWTMFDGTTRSNLTLQQQGGNAFNGYIGVVHGEMKFASSGSKTVEIQVTGARTGASDCQIQDDVLGFTDLQIAVYRHPVLP